MTKPCIIIPRPIEDAEITAGLLAENDFNYFIEPIIKVIPVSENINKLANLIETADGIIITSRNSLKVLNSLPSPILGRLISLGKSTTDLAHRLGLKNIEYAGENVAEVCEYIKTNYKGKSLIYASGETITKELSQRNCGADIKRVIIYKTIAAQSFSDSFIKRLKHGDFNAIVFFSSKTAEVFCKLLKKESLDLYIENLYAFCLSAGIEKTIKSYGFRATMSAKKPHINAIIKLLVKFKF